MFLFHVVPRVTVATAGNTHESGVEQVGKSPDALRRAAAETIKEARKSLDVLTNAGVIPLPSLPVVRRLSTVPGLHGLVDFEKSMIIWEVREVGCSDRSAAWFRFDPLLCSQRAKGAAPGSMAG